MSIRTFLTTIKNWFSTKNQPARITELELSAHLARDIGLYNISSNAASGNGQVPRDVAASVRAPTIGGILTRAP